MVKFIKLQAAAILVAALFCIFTSHITENILSKPLADFMNFIRTGYYGTHKLDEKGIPQVYNARLKQRYNNPVYVSIYAFYYFNKYMETESDNYFLKYYKLENTKIEGLSKKQYLEYFINCADWLLSNLKLNSFEKMKFGIWRYDFPLEIYDLKPGWVSGMAQGIGIQVLIRAYKLEGNQEYLNAAKNALNAFYVNVENGGVTYKDDGNEWWYEEYAAPDAKESRVLNGMEHALIGIYEYYETTQDAGAIKLFKKGLASLKYNIKNFDAGWWTYYDDLGNLANKKYHHVNIELTKKLHEITDESLLLSLSQKWNGYKPIFFIREFIRQKPNYIDILILTSNLAGILLILEFLVFITTFLNKNKKKVINIRKKICHFSSVHSASDIRIFHKECKTLAKSGYEVVLIAKHNKNEKVDDVNIIALPDVRNQIYRMFVLTFKALLLALKQKADVYHFHDPELIPIGVFLKILTRKKVVYDAHENYRKQILSKPYLPKISRGSIAFFTKTIEYFSSFFFDAIITATNDILKIFSYHKRAVVLRNLPALSAFPELNQKKKDESHIFRLIYTGVIVEIRGITQIIKSLRFINPNKQIKLILCGRFYPYNYKEKVRSLEEFKKVEYLGWLEPRVIPEVLWKSNAGIVCFLPEPNHIESMPNKIFEYMAAGLPVIASNFPLWKEIVESNKCGICVDPLKPNEIAKAVEYLAENREMARKMGKNGRKAVLEKYNWESESNKLLKIYEDLLNE